MKIHFHAIRIIVVLVLSCIGLHAQSTDSLLFQNYATGFDNYAVRDRYEASNALRIPIGLVTINNQKYVGARVQPEFKFGKMGVGMDIPMIFGQTNKSLRQDEYKGGNRLFRYIRFGVRKQDKYFLRIGDLSGEFLGHGALLNNYTNSPSFEQRKTGAIFDIRPIDFIGIEGITSNLFGQGMTSLRAYTRPLTTTNIKFLKDVEAGFTYLNDKDAQNDSTQFVRSGLRATGLDLGLTLAKNSTMQLSLYGQYNTLSKVNSDTLTKKLASLAKIDPNNASFIQNYTTGTGLAVGTRLRLQAIANKLNFDIRLERLSNSDYYLPQFFNGVYEINKDKQILRLSQARRQGGTFGSLAAVITNKVRVSGGLLAPDQIGTNSPGFIRLDADAFDVIGGLTLSGRYLKGNLASFEDAFVLDQRALLATQAMYRFGIFMVGADYRWTFTPYTDAKGKESVKATEYFMPYAGLYVNFDKKKKGNWLN
jgi:hypothetical protein